MSDARCLTRLRWHCGAGYACHDGVRVELDRVPRIGPANVTEIDFELGCCAELREGFDARRELHKAEVDAILALLRRIATAARAAAES